jgi:hypothetical protein
LRIADLRKHVLQSAAPQLLLWLIMSLSLSGVRASLFQMESRRGDALGAEGLAKKLGVKLLELEEKLA